MDFDDLYGYVDERRLNPNIGIPLAFTGTFKQVLSCIDKGDFWIITAQTSCFKSAFLRSNIVLPILNYAGNNPNIKVKIFMFLLEENEEDYMVQVLSYLLYKKFGIEVSEDSLHGRGEKLSEEVMEMISLLKPQIEFFKKHVELVTSDKNSYGMYKRVKQYMLENGTLEYKDVNGDKIPKHYIPNNPDEYVFFVVDHVSEILPEKGGTLYTAIDDLRGKYCMTLKNLYRVIPILVQQQVMTGDQLVTDMKGKTLAEKLSPSLAELADNKGTARAATHVISLFNPGSYNLNEYRGFTELTRIKDNFLFLNVHKNRRGKKNAGTGLWVNPVVKYFEMFPSDKTEQIKFLQNKLNR